MESALDSFKIILLIGAGTGLIYILRWFWWRINAYTEVAGMVISFIVAITLRTPAVKEALNLKSWQELLLGVIITTVGWLIVTFLTRPTHKDKLLSFYQKVQPDSYGWKPIAKETGIVHTGEITTGLKAMFVTIFLIYGTLFGTGYLLFGQWNHFLISLLVIIVSSYLLYKLWPKLKLSH